MTLSTTSRIGLGALALAGLMACTTPSTLTAGAAAPAAAGSTRGTQAPGYWRLQLGDATVTALYDGAAYLPASLLKGIAVPDAQALLAGSWVPVTKDGVQTAVNGFLIRRGGALVLIDAGAAACFGPTTGRLAANLRAAGYEPGDITHVLLTHLHPDHACGIADGAQRVFPNAQVLASRGDADFWLSESVAAKAPTGAQGMFRMARDATAPYRAAGRFTAFDPGAPLPIPGIRIEPTPGHTPGHTSYLVQTTDGDMLVWGDIVHSHSIQFQKPEVAIEFDSDAAQAVATRQRVLQQASGSRVWIAGAHLPFPGLGHVRAEPAGGYRWVPAEYGPLVPAAGR